MHRIVAPALAVGSVAAVVAVAAGSTPSPTPAGAAAITTVTFTEAERRDTLAYWTPDKMRKVGAAADLGRDAKAVKPWQGPALKTVGRLFFTNDKGEDSYCTATAVRGDNRSTVMTAGHCVQLPASPANHHTNMVFVPGYSEGERPYGTYVVRSVAMPRSWAEDAENDIAAVVVDPQQGKPLADAVGAQPVALDREPGGEVTVLGYPDSREQRGERLMSCTGTTKATSEGQQSVPCPMEGGASGGPWLAGLDAKSGLGELVSVNSFGDAATEGSAMQGEVLGAVAGQVLSRAGQL